MDHLSKFHLNQSVNKLGNAVLWKLHKLEKKKWWRLAPRSGRWRLAGLYYCRADSGARKVQKQHFSRTRAPLTSQIWRLAADRVPPGGIYCSGQFSPNFKQQHNSSLHQIPPIQFRPHLPLFNNPIILLFPFDNSKFYQFKFSIIDSLSNNSSIHPYRQALHPTIQNWVKILCIAWRSGMYR